MTDSRTCDLGAKTFQPPLRARTKEEGEDGDVGCPLRHGPSLLPQSDIRRRRHLAFLVDELDSCACLTSVWNSYVRVGAAHGCLLVGR